MKLIDLTSDTRRMLALLLCNGDEARFNEWLYHHNLIRRFGAYEGVRWAALRCGGVAERLRAEGDFEKSEMFAKLAVFLLRDANAMFEEIKAEADAKLRQKAIGEA